MKVSINKEKNRIEIIINKYIGVYFNINKIKKVNGIYELNGILEDENDELMIVSGAIDDNCNEIIPISFRKLIEEKNVIDIILFENDTAVMKNVNGSDYFISLSNPSFNIINNRPVPTKYILKQDSIKLLEDNNLFCSYDNKCFLFNRTDFTIMTPELSEVNLYEKDNRMVYEAVITPDELESEANFSVVLEYDQKSYNLINSYVYLKVDKPIIIYFIMPKNIVSRQEIINYASKVVRETLGGKDYDSLKKGRILN